MPAAFAYDRPPEFAGAWVGKIDTGQTDRGNVDALTGEMSLGELEPGRFFGSFVSDDGGTEFVLLLEQSRVRTEAGGEVASNRMIFTWQDGLGARGRGWLLINREETELTGAHGIGQAYDGSGLWSFVRFDD